MSMARGHFAASLLIGAAACTAARGQVFELTWCTIDGGGVMNSTDGQSGGYELSGTIGQHDTSSFAAPMSGGTYEMVAGFWPVATSPACSCLGDLNADNELNGADIQQFVACMVANGGCSCADIDQSGGVTVADVSLFVNALLSAMECP